MELDMYEITSPSIAAGRQISLNKYSSCKVNFIPG
jgi:hypothetical protein